MEAVNKILGREVPATNGIPVHSSENNADLSTPQMEVGKKILLNVDNLSEKEQKRRNLIEQIQALHKDGFSVQEISQITGKIYRFYNQKHTKWSDLVCDCQKTGRFEICRNYYKYQTVYMQGCICKWSGNQEVL